MCKKSIADGGKGRSIDTEMQVSCMPYPTAVMETTAGETSSTTLESMLRDLIAARRSGDISVAQTAVEKRPRLLLLLASS